MSTSDLSRIRECWQDASDADVARALSNLEDYPNEVRDIIQAEARKRNVQAGDAALRESSSVRFAKRGLSGAARFAQSHWVLSAFTLGVIVRVAVIPLERHVQRWPVGLWLALYLSIWSAGLALICLPLRSYRRVARATGAAYLGNVLINMVLFALVFSNRVNLRRPTGVLLAMATVVLVWLVAALPVFGAVWARKRYWPIPEPGHCVSCDYDLRGLPLPRCPECGRPFDPAEMDRAGADLPSTGNFC